MHVTMKLKENRNFGRKIKPEKYSLNAVEVVDGGGGGLRPWPHNARSVLILKITEC